MVFTADAVQVVVEDDGIGMSVSRRNEEVLRTGGQFGLFSIRERLRHFGGLLILDSAPGCGTRVTVVAPLGKLVETK